MLESETKEVMSVIQCCMDGQKPDEAERLEVPSDQIRPPETLRGQSLPPSGCWRHG
jgi:hypothetical protein